MAIIDIRIRTFKAVEDQISCEKYLEGHTNVLKYYGINQVTSAKMEWFSNPDAYAIVAECAKTGELVGGIRAHVANYTHTLPLVEAIEEIDSSITGFVESLMPERTGEICGLWNSRTVKGMGISLILMRTVIAILPQLKLKTFLGLCAPHTYEQLTKLGYVVITTVGNNGTFYYPKEDLLATAIIIKDVINLSNADEVDKSIVLGLRNNLIQQKVETGPLGEINVDYNLVLGIKPS